MGERIPGTNPDWGRNLPEEYSNSLVDENGNSYDNGFNFDEKDDDSNGWDEVAEMADSGTGVETAMEDGWTPMEPTEEDVTYSNDDSGWKSDAPEEPGTQQI